MVSPGTKERLAEEEWLLGPREASIFRSVVARGNYLSQDRPDIRFVVKELCQRMSKPTNVDMLKLKRLCRYLAGASRAVQSEGAVVSDTFIDVFVDADWGVRKDETIYKWRGACCVWEMCEGVVINPESMGEKFGGGRVVCGDERGHGGIRSSEHVC